MWCFWELYETAGKGLRIVGYNLASGKLGCPIMEEVSRRILIVLDCIGEEKISPFYIKIPSVKDVMLGRDSEERCFL